MGRRLIVLILLLVTASALLRPTVAQSPPTPPGQGQQPRNTLPDPPTPKKGKVREENQKPGDTGWKSAELSRGRGTPLTKYEPRPGAPGAAAAAVWTDTVIRGYAGLTSINRGGSLPLYIGTTQASYSLDVYRMGYYGGSGARLLSSVPSLPGQNQAVPTPDINGMVAANWSVSYTLSTGADWVSGFYLVKLIASSGAVGYITFVLRDDGDPADILYQAPVSTYQAYNNWGGKSLYDYNSTNSVQAVKVSFDRPYTAWSGAGGFFDGDYNMVRWLEKRGYDVDYATSIDTHTSPSVFSGRKVFLSNFHDEYWSRQMRDNVLAARNAGVSLAFLNANSVYCHIRFESSASGSANRVIVYYGVAAATSDPVGWNSPDLATRWRETPPLPAGVPENSLLGVMYESNFTYTTAFAWVVQNASHWVYTGTGLVNGNSIPELVGYEYDKVWNNGQTPAGLVALSASPVVDAAGTPGTHNAGVYRAASGAWVFTAGTIRWAWKMDDNEYQHWGADARVQRMTVNVLNTMITGATPSPTPTPAPAPLALTIYGDTLASGWSDASWSATVNYAATNPVYSGTKSIAYSVTGAYGALYLSAATAVNSAPYGAVRFAAQATQAGQRYNLALYDQNGAQVGNNVVLANYGGDPLPGVWKLYTIPLDADNLNAAGKLIKGIMLQDYTGHSQPVLFVDEVGFTSANAPTPTPTPTPTPAPTPSPTPAPTPTPTPTPTPSPSPTPPPSVTPTPTPTPVPTPTPTRTPRPKK